MKVLPLLVAGALGLTVAAAAGLDRKQADPSNAAGTRTNEQAGESAAGKSMPSGPAQNQDDPGRAAQIRGSASGTTSLSPEQREKMSAYVSRNKLYRVDNVNFSIAIGAAVPRQAELRDLPKPLTNILQGYSGDKYILVRDQLVIVDSKARRVVAIIPNAG